jgi:hypothetical protein
MQVVERFILGGVFALVSLLGLGMAAHFGGGLHYSGYLLFVICVGLIFSQIAGISFGDGDAASGLPLRPILRSLACIRTIFDSLVGPMGTIEKFFTGGLLGLFAVICLFVAARHGEGASYWGGLALFVILVGMIFYLITRADFGSKHDAAH